MRTTKLSKELRLLLAGTALVAFYCIFGVMHQRITGVESFKRNVATDSLVQQQDYIAKTVNTGYEIKQQQEQRQHPLCEGYDGILFISHVIATAGAGTLFFLSLVDSLLYAKKYNLYPYIHVNNDLNKPCYDANVHGVGPKITFEHVTGRLTNVIGTGNMTCMNKQNNGAMHHPGSPDFENLKMKKYTLRGNGLWNSYFEPLSAFPFDDESCQDKPVFQMKRHQVDREMHRCSEVAVRSWLFQGTPKALLPANDNSLHEWLWGHRQRASQVIQQHYKLQPWLLPKVQDANPNPQQCLAAHIRLTDKAKVRARDKKGLNVYRPYIEAYAKASKDNGSSPIYIATDDARVIDTIKEEWSKEVSSRIIMQSNVTRSESNKPTFKILQDDKHRSNTEALVEVYAMSKCSFFVHGFSGMAEAVVYINPTLHDQSVNIDDPNKQTPKEFGNMVKKVLATKAQ